MADGSPPALQPTLSDPRANNNPIPTRSHYVGKQNQNQGSGPTILKNPTWSTVKCSAVEYLKRTKANISLFDMLQNFPNQREALLKTLDHNKAMPTKGH